MGVTTNLINKPFNPRAQDQSPKGFNRAKLYSGKALDFDGVNDFANVVYSDTIGSVWTWSSIIEADALSGYQVLFGGTYGANNGLIVLKNNQLNIYTNTDNLFSYTLETGKKYHVALSQSGSNVSAFINGVLVDSVNLSVTLDAGGGSYYISRNPSFAIEFFNGKLSGVKLFNTALTAAQVADLYNNPEKVVPTGVDNTALKLWLPMMEGAGTTALNGAPDAIGSELVTNGDFASNINDWAAKDCTIVWDNGKIKCDNSSGNSGGGAYQNVGLQNNKTYRFTATIQIISASGNGAFRVATSAANGTGQSTRYTGSTLVAGGDAVTEIGEFTTGTDGDVAVQFNVDRANAVFTIDNVSVKEISNNGTISGATWTHGIGAPVAQTAVINWNKHTLDGTNEVLIPQGLTSGRDLLGNLFENVRKQGALNLDGNSWGKVHPNNSFAFGTGAFSLEAWAKLEYLQTGSYANEIICLNDLDEFAIKTISAGTSFSAGSGVSISHTITLDNSWAHIVGVKNADGSMKLYINGVEKVSNSAGSSTASVPVTNPVRLGTDSNEASRTYKDQIAQPRIYNRALTAEEVQRSYDSGKNIYTNS